MSTRDRCVEDRCGELCTGSCGEPHTCELQVGHDGVHTRTCPKPPNPHVIEDLDGTGFTYGAAK